MRAGDPDHVAPGHRLGERLGAADHGDPERAAAREFGMIVRHGGRDDERARRLRVRGGVAHVHRDPETIEVGVPSGGVAAGDGRAAAGEQLGQRAHARAGRPHEMDGARIGEIEK